MGCIFIDTYYIRKINKFVLSFFIKEKTRNELKYWTKFEKRNFIAIPQPQITLFRLIKNTGQQVFFIIQVNIKPEKWYYIME